MGVCQPNAHIASSCLTPIFAIKMPEITAIVCTHNRAQVLGDTLKSLARQTLPAWQYAIMVVNNASTDTTRDVVLAFQASTEVGVQYLEEPRLGIAIARNRGWQAAATEFVAYIDDDARAEPDWLETHLTTFRSVTLQPACITGKVNLDWVGGRPAWFPDRYESLIARYDFGDEPKWHSPKGYLVTCNAAFPTEILRGQGGFREGLGHRGRGWHGGEDNEIFTRLMSRGLPIYYQPKALVTHLTPPERQTPNYLLKRMFASGLAQGALDVLSRERRSGTLWRLIAWDARMTVMYLGGWLLSLLNGNHSQRWENAYGVMQKLGRLRTEFALAGLPLTRDDRLRVRQLKNAA